MQVLAVIWFSYFLFIYFIILAQKSDLRQEMQDFDQETETRHAGLY